MRPRLAFVAALLAALLAIACGDDDSAAGDAGNPDAGPTGIPAPAPPAPPVLTPCPAGWRELAVDGEPTRCEPWPEDRARDCAAGEAHFPGEPDCAPVGTACPAGSFADDLPSDRPIVYVLAGAPAGGDGTQSSPLDRIARTYAGLDADGIVAIGVGDYDTLVQPPPGLTFWGACAASTILRSSVAAMTAGVVSARGLGAALRNLSIGPSPRPAIWLDGAVDLELEGVVIEGATGLGVYVGPDAALRAHRLVLARTQPLPSGDFGVGMDARGTVELRSVVSSGHRDNGLFVYEGGSLLLEDSAITDTQPELSSTLRGYGMGVQGGATAEITRSTFERNTDIGIFVGDSSGMVHISDSVVRDSGGGLSPTSGRGIAAQVGAPIALERVALDRNASVSLFTASDGTTVDATDLVIADGGDRGIEGQLVTSLSVTRALIARNRRDGAFIGTTGTVTLTDVVVEDTDVHETAGYGWGMSLSMGLRGTAERVRLASNLDLGLFVSASTVELTDLAVVGTRADAGGESGWGISVQDQADVTVERALFDGNREASVFCDGSGTSLTMTDGVISDTEPSMGSASGGFGLVVQEGAGAEVSSARFERSHESSIFVADEGTTLALRSVTITASLPIPSGEFGHGIVSILGAAARADDFEITDSHLCGVFVGEGGALDLSHGEVAEAAIGACVQVDGYDLARLTTEVSYLDNGVNLDATSLPIPDPLTAAVPGT